jgi:hypothetical protein
VATSGWSNPRNSDVASQVTPAAPTWLVVGNSSSPVHSASDPSTVTVRDQIGAPTVRTAAFDFTELAPPAPRRAAAWKATVSPGGSVAGTASRTEARPFGSATAEPE